MKKVSCIIPAYNEGERIEKILNIIIGHPLIYEIIVIDDGSKDNTKEIIEKFEGITFIKHEKNQGKSISVYDGIVKATGEYILMLDADLIGLTKKDVTDLIEPVINDIADLSISLRGNTPKFWQKIGIDYISGERVFKKDLLKNDLEKITKIRGFGLEVFLNSVIIENKCSIKVVSWKDVQSPIKYKKFLKIFTANSNLYMAIEIMKNISIFEIYSQNVKMLRLLVKD